MYIYSLLLVFYAFSIISYLLMLYNSTNTVENLSKILSSIIAVASSFSVICLFKSVRNFFVHYEEKNEIKNVQAVNLIVKSLYAIAFFDVIHLINNLAFKVQYQPASSGFYGSDNFLVPVVKFIENNTSLLSEITNILIPRPIGFFALLLAIFISSFLKRTA